MSVPDTLFQSNFNEPMIRTLFVPDLLRNFSLLKDGPMRELFDLAEPCDLANPEAWTPLDLFAQMCAWLEGNVGPASLKASGERTGLRIYKEIIRGDKLPPGEPGPIDLLRSWVHQSKALFRDPDQRGWTVRELGPQQADISCDLPLHPILQLGLFYGLVSPTGVRFPQVERLGDAEAPAAGYAFRVTWFPAAGKS